MRVCILGNSHVASLKNGWDLIKADSRDLDLTFFASPRGTMSGLSLEGGDLVPTNSELAHNLAYTSGGAARVSVGAYDAFLIYGHFQMPKIDNRLSSAVAMAVCHDLYVKSWSYRFASMVRQLTKAPIFVGHTPLRCGKPDADPNRLGYSEVLALLNTAFRPSGFTFASQPPVTNDKGWATKAEFSKDAVRLEVGDKKGLELSAEDRRHMNKEFGRLYLTSLFQDWRGATANAA